MSRKSRYDVTQQRSQIWRAGAYIRLSREDERLTGKDSQSVITQRRIIEKFLSEHPEINCIDFFIDDGFSGTNMERPRFQALQEAFENGAVNCIIVKDLSRLARNYEEASNLVKVIFPFYRIRFISVNDKVDSFEDPESVYRLDVSFKNMMNDEYSHDLSIKVKTAAEIRRQNGEFLGAFAPFGYQKEPTDPHHLVIDEEAAKTVRRIFADYLAHPNFSKLAQQLTDEEIPAPIAYKQVRGCKLKYSGNSNRHAWHASTVKRILMSDIYIGNLTQQKFGVVSYKDHRVTPRREEDWITVEGTHEPIISAELFKAVQAAMAHNHRVKKRQGKPSIFGGIAKCGNCGCLMSVTGYLGKDKYRAYYCYSKYKRKADCAYFRIKESVLEEAVLTALNSYLRLFVDLKKALERAERASLKKAAPQTDPTAAIATIEAEKRELYLRLKEGELTQEVYLEQRKRLDERISLLKGKPTEPIADDQQDHVKSFEQSSFFELFAGRKVFRRITREIARAFIKEILIYSLTEIKIIFAFEDEFLSYLEYVGETEKVQELSARKVHI